MTFIYALASVLIVSGASLVGVFTLFFNQKLLKSILFLLVSLSVGTLFGDALLHLLPEAYENASNFELVSFATLSGILAFLILEKVFRWHHSHGTLEDENEHCEHEHTRGVHPLGKLVLVSDGLHNFLDGIIIAAGFLVSTEIGIATTIAVLLHEIPQEIGDFALLVHAGFGKAKALIFNFLSALVAVLGVFTAFYIVEGNEHYIPYVAAFAAGSFLYIAGSDLVPELHKKNGARESAFQLIAVLLGVAIMIALLFLE